MRPSATGGRGGSRRRSAAGMRGVRSRPSTLEAAAARKYVPSSATAMPTEHTSRYFHVASSDRALRWRPTRGALTSVVASTATHSRPACRLRHTRVMAARNPGRQATSTVRRRRSASSAGASDIVAAVATADAAKRRLAIESTRRPAASRASQSPTGPNRPASSHRQATRPACAAAVPTRSARRPGTDRTRSARSDAASRHQEQREDHGGQSLRSESRSASRSSNSPADAEHRDPHHEDRGECVQERAHLDEERLPLGERHAEGGDAVLEREVAEHLHDRRRARHHEEETGEGREERRRHEQRPAAPRRSRAGASRSTGTRR